MENGADRASRNAYNLLKTKKIRWSNGHYGPQSPPHFPPISAPFLPRIYPDPAGLLTRSCRLQKRRFAWIYGLTYPAEIFRPNCGGVERSGCRLRQTNSPPWRVLAALRNKQNEVFPLRTPIACFGQNDKGGSQTAPLRLCDFAGFFQLLGEAFFFEGFAGFFLYILFGVATFTHRQSFPGSNGFRSLKSCILQSRPIVGTKGDGVKGKIARE